MVHHRQRLALGLEPGDDTPRIHPELNHLESYAPADRLRLFRHIDYAPTAFAQLLADFVRPDGVAWFLRRRRIWNNHGWIRACGQGRLKEFAGVLVGLKQDLDAPAQLDIIA